MPTAIQARLRAVMAGLLFPCVALAANTDRIYTSILVGYPVDKGVSYGAEAGVESDWFSPHDIVAGVIGMASADQGSSDLVVVRGVNGLGGIFLGYRLRPRKRFSPFVGVMGLDSFPGGDQPYWALCPEAGFSWRVSEQTEVGVASRYYFTTHGRDDDLWTCGISFGYRLN
ncbi:MAG: hypothetical protein V1929_13435 [bacterium]